MIKGTIEFPGDKSISHRSIIIPSISLGISEIENPTPKYFGWDCIFFYI